MPCVPLPWCRSTSRIATRAALRAQALRGNRRIVEEAEAAGDVGEGMMAGRAAKRIGGRLAGEHGVGGFHRDPGAPAGAVKGFGRDRAGGVGHVVAGLADRGGRIGTAAGDRMDVGDHFGRRTLDALPALVDARQEIQIFRRVDRRDRAQARNSWAERSCSPRPCAPASSRSTRSGFSGLGCGAPLDRKALGSWRFCSSA